MHIVTTKNNSLWSTWQLTIIASLVHTRPSYVSYEGMKDQQDMDPDNLVM